MRQAQQRLAAEPEIREHRHGALLLGDDLDHQLLQTHVERLAQREPGQRAAESGAAPASRRSGSRAPAGFRELSRAIEGVSDSVVSDRLSELAAGGLITRIVDAGPPVTVAFALTQRGHALMPALEQFARWAQDNLPADDC